MKIIKRNGTEVDFDKNKIIIAISKANAEVKDEQAKLTDNEIRAIASDIEATCKNNNYIMNIEDIQNLVEEEIVNNDKYHVAQKYIRFRYKRELVRKSNSTDDSILSLIELKNEDINEENSNKNPAIISTQRDYMAGEVSKDITKRFLLPEKIINAHNEGLIHFHDMDYFAQHSHNCCLVNLEDMLQNGTVISKTMIEKPHRFLTACNIATQIIAQVASCQYGGQSISLTHLAPFVNDSRKVIRENLIKDLSELGIIGNFTDTQIDNIVENRVRKEIADGVQVIQYQILTLMTTNGQTPFITVFLYLNETDDPQTKKDLALIIQEVLQQRILGVKNEKGVYITPAFPKLIYVLDEDNIYPDSKYYYLTELAAKCTAKRMVPDYISAKVMKQIKENCIFPSMG